MCRETTHYMQINNINSFKKYLFIYFWLCWVFGAAQAFSLAVESGVYSGVAVSSLLIVVASLVAQGSRVLGLQ